MTQEQYNAIREELMKNMEHAAHALQVSKPETMAEHTEESWEMRKTLIHNKMLADQALDILTQTCG